MMESIRLKYFILNNDIVRTSDFDQKILYKSDIYYEVVRVSDSVPLFLKEHIQRLYKSISKSGIFTDFTTTDVENLISTIIKINDLDEGNIRFQFSSDDQNRLDFTAWIIPHYYPKPVQYKTGVKTVTIKQQRQNPSIKKFNRRLKNITEDFISKTGAYEAILVNNLNYITEGSKSNVFFIKQNKIYTPGKVHVLPGITRDKVIEIANSNNLIITETEIIQDDISAFESAFITNTSSKVLPLNLIDKIKYDVNNQITRFLMYEYDKLIEHEKADFIK